MKVPPQLKIAAASRRRELKEDLSRIQRSIQARNYKKTFENFQTTVRLADQGVRVEMHGVNYVVMSRSIYDDLQKRAQQ